MKEKKVVFMALSGGVDSAVSAYLLKKQGYDVRAVFMKNWTGTTENLAGECHWTRERDDAKAVARKLKIPFAVWNFEREYRKLVIDHFFKEYQRGRTPNPDVRCNQYVKIPMFLKRALKEGADHIATGHYARVVPPGQQDKYYQLLAGVDESKDQSYFLYNLKQSQLRYLLFPVGGLLKVQVRALARRAQLPVAEKPDSQGICFVGEVNLEDFLLTRIPKKPGNMVSTRGRVLGQHKGLAFYTIGQRQGLGLANGPWYVVGRSWKKNELILGTLTEQRLIMAKQCTVSLTHWIGSHLELPSKVLVRHRYRHPAVPAILSRVGKHIRIRFKLAQRAITPGQSAVFYQLTKLGLGCLGGAVIQKVEKKGFLW